MSNSTRVVPAILTDDPKALVTMVRQAEGFTDYVQLDIMDGKFVPSRSVTWRDIASLHIKLRWEAHLMVMQPEEQLAGFKQAGARRVVFHYEATESPRDVISQARRLRLEVGIAINPETPVSEILPLVSKVDSVLFLSVNPGFYGSKFIPEVLNKLTDLRKAGQKIELGIDGGIKEDNIVPAARSSANVIYVGSAIFRDIDPAGAYRRLLKLVLEPT